MYGQVGYGRFIKAFVQKYASLPTGSLLTMLDLLARAQFMEALSGKRFNTVSARAAGSKQRLSQAIGKMMMDIDPTFNPFPVETTSPDGKSYWTQPSAWVNDEGSSGLYKAAWLGANRVFAKTQSSSTGVPLEATDLLSANMVQSLEGRGEGVLSPDELAELMESGSDEHQKDIIQKQLEAINNLAIQDAAIGHGNFFFEAGKRFKPKADKIISGQIGIDDVGGAVALYAKNAAINAVKARNAELRIQDQALRQEMAPAEGEAGEFDLDTLTPIGWNFIIQEVLADPSHEFSKKLFGWMVDDLDMAVADGLLTENEQVALRVYFEEMRLGRPIGDIASFVARLNATVTESGWKPVSRTNFQNYLRKYMAVAGKRLAKNPPKFYTDASDYVFLINAQKGRGKFASTDQELRSKVIRLAHAQPELRPYLLPLVRKAQPVVKKASDEGALAGRTWGVGGHGTGKPGARQDWNDPYERHSGHPPAGCNKNNPPKDCKGTYEERKKYNQWYRDEVCPGKHPKGCNMPGAKT